MGNGFSLCGTCNLDFSVEDMSKDLKRLEKDLDLLKEKYDRLNNHMLININNDIGVLKIQLAEIKVELKYIREKLN